MVFSLKPFLKLKSTWLIITGMLMVALSPFFVWVTATVSVPPPLYGQLNIIITGQDATWNVTFGPQGILRMLYFQLASLALAVLALLLKIFLPLETPRWLRGSIVLASGIIGLFVPVVFIYVGISEAQRLSSQFQWLIDVLATLKIQIPYDLSVGPGLILAVLSPVLLLISGVLVLREKT